MAKAVLRGKFIAIQSHLKKQEKSQINNLTLYLRQLEKEEQRKPKVRRRKEIIKIRAEISEIEMKKTIAKINKAKSWFFGKINKTDKPLARLIKKKRERMQIHKIIMDNHEEMDKFLERYNFPRLKQEELENINRPITSNEIENVVKNLPTNRSPGPDGFTGKFYETFREELTLILSNSSKNNAEGGTLPNSSYEATITLIPKAENDIPPKRKL